MSCTMSLREGWRGARWQAAWSVWCQGCSSAAASASAAAGGAAGAAVLWQQQRRAQPGQQQLPSGTAVAAQGAGRRVRAPLADDVHGHRDGLGCCGGCCAANKAGEAGQGGLRQPQAAARVVGRALCCLQRCQVELRRAGRAGTSSWRGRRERAGWGLLWQAGAPGACAHPGAARGAHAQAARATHHSRGHGAKHHGPEAPVVAPDPVLVPDLLGHLLGALRRGCAAGWCAWRQGAAMPAPCSAVRHRTRQGRAERAAPGAAPVQQQPN
jgi:hypothetical protein